MPMGEDLTFSFMCKFANSAKCFISVSKELSSQFNRLKTVKGKELGSFTDPFRLNILDGQDKVYFAIMPKASYIDQWRLFL